MPLSDANTMFRTYRPMWEDSAMSTTAWTDHGHVVAERNREGMPGYLQWLHRFVREKKDLDVLGTEVLFCVLFPCTVVDKNGKERPATPLEAWSQSAKAGERFAENIGSLCATVVSFLLAKKDPPIKRIESFDWSEGGKEPPVDRGKVERLDPWAGGDGGEDIRVYPRSDAMGMDRRIPSSASVAFLPVPPRALEDKGPRRIEGPRRGLPKPDRGQDR
jgi:hypothetical protein